MTNYIYTEKNNWILQTFKNKINEKKWLKLYWNVYDISRLNNANKGSN